MSIIIFVVHTTASSLKHAQDNDDNKDDSLLCNLEDPELSSYPKIGLEVCKNPPTFLQ